MYICIYAIYNNYNIPPYLHIIHTQAIFLISIFPLKIRLNRVTVLLNITKLVVGNAATWDTLAKSDEIPKKNYIKKNSGKLHFSLFCLIEEFIFFFKCARASHNSCISHYSVKI